VGQTHRRKNIPFLLRIFEKMCSQKPMDFVIVGPSGDGEEQILNLIQASPFRKNIKKYNE
jgi:hypothetical protein